MNIRFELLPSDGKRCAQVLVYNQDDLDYWTTQCEKQGYLMAKDYHVEENQMGYPDSPHDVYQIFPQELSNFYTELVLAPLI